MSADRGLFVCQSQSLNLFFDKPTFKEITSAHFYGWKLGLKTGMYYLRTKSAKSAQNFGLSVKTEKKLLQENIDKSFLPYTFSCSFHIVTSYQKTLISSLYILFATSIELPTPLSSGYIYSNPPCHKLFIGDLKLGKLLIVLIVGIGAADSDLKTLQSFKLFIDKCGYKFKRALVLSLMIKLLFFLKNL